MANLTKQTMFSLPGLDYKALMSGDDPLSVLSPLLVPTNVHVVAKLATKVPYKVSVF